MDPRILATLIALGVGLLMLGLAKFFDSAFRIDPDEIERLQNERKNS